MSYSQSHGHIPDHLLPGIVGSLWRTCLVLWESRGPRGLGDIVSCTIGNAMATQWKRCLHQVTIEKAKLSRQNDIVGSFFYLSWSLISPRSNWYTGIYRWCPAKVMDKVCSGYLAKAGSTTNSSWLSSIPTGCAFRRMRFRTDKGTPWLKDAINLYRSI